MDKKVPVQKSAPKQGGKNGGPTDEQMKQYGRNMARVMNQKRG